MLKRDRELEAIEELARRRQQLAVRIAAPIIAASIFVGFGLYFVLRELQFEMWGMHVPWATGLTAFLPSVGGAIGLARWVSSIAGKARRAAWIDEVAAQHQVSPASLQEYFGEWS